MTWHGRVPLKGNQLSGIWYWLGLAWNKNYLKGMERVVQSIVP